MIAFQIILAAVVILIGWRLLTLRSTAMGRAWKKIGLAILIAGALMVVIWPDITNAIAHSVGISRGADLMLYILIVAFIFDRINDYARRKDENKQLVSLARHIALSDAERNNK